MTTIKGHSMTTHAELIDDYWGATNEVSCSKAFANLRRALRKLSVPLFNVDDLESLSEVAAREELKRAATNAGASEILKLIGKVDALPAAVRQAGIAQEVGLPALADATPRGSNPNEMPSFD